MSLASSAASSVASSGTACCSSRMRVFSNGVYITTRSALAVARTIAAAMVRATANAERVVMYTPFEKTRIRELQQAVPELATELAALEAKLIDLHPVVKNCVYHPDFRGSFSLKYILTPLVPELTYDDLVIVDGRVASVEIARLLFVADKIPRHERYRVRQDLLDYCEGDTWAMVKLVERPIA